MLRLSLVGDGFADVDASLLTLDDDSLSCWRPDADEAVARYRLDQVLSIQTADAGMVSRLRQDHPNAYRRWTAESEQAVVDAYKSGDSLADIAEAAGRRVGGIRSRLVALGVIDPEPGDRVSFQTSRALAEAAGAAGAVDPGGADGGGVVPTGVEPME
jgi:hypothetical protein